MPLTDSNFCSGTGLHSELQSLGFGRKCLIIHEVIANESRHFVVAMAGA